MILTHLAIPAMKFIILISFLILLDWIDFYMWCYVFGGIVFFLVQKHRPKFNFHHSVKYNINKKFLMYILKFLYDLERIAYGIGLFYIAYRYLDDHKLHYMLVTPYIVMYFLLGCINACAILLSEHSRIIFTIIIHCINIAIAYQINIIITYFLIIKTLSYLLSICVNKVFIAREE